jgi:predicted transcriptional regulator
LEEASFSATRKVKHDVGITVRLDWDIVKELERIALFEHEKRAALLRRIIIEKVQVYQRNPAYKRFIKQLEATSNVPKPVQR